MCICISMCCCFSFFPKILAEHIVLNITQCVFYIKILVMKRFFSPCFFSLSFLPQAIKVIQFNMFTLFSWLPEILQLNFIANSNNKLTKSFWKLSFNFKFI